MTRVSSSSAVCLDPRQTTTTTTTTTPCKTVLYDIVIMNDLVHPLLRLSSANYCFGYAELIRVPTVPARNIYTHARRVIVVLIISLCGTLPPRSRFRFPTPGVISSFGVFFSSPSRFHTVPSYRQTAYITRRPAERAVRETARDNRNARIRRVRERTVASRAFVSAGGTSSLVLVEFFATTTKNRTHISRRTRAEEEACERNLVLLEISESLSYRIPPSSSSRAYFFATPRG